MNVLFIVPYPSGGGSNRLRVEQYLPLLRKHGVGYAVRPFLCSARFYDILYRPGRIVRKGIRFTALSMKVSIVWRASHQVNFLKNYAAPLLDICHGGESKRSGGMKCIDGTSLARLDIIKCSTLFFGELTFKS